MPHTHNLHIIISVPPPLPSLTPCVPGEEENNLSTIWLLLEHVQHGSGQVPLPPSSSSLPCLSATIYQPVLRGTLLGLRCQIRVLTT